MDLRAPRTSRSPHLQRVWPARRTRADADSRSRRQTLEPWPSLRLVLERHPRALRTPGKVAMPHLPDRLALVVFAHVHLGAAELAAARQRIAVSELDGERRAAREPSHVAADAHAHVFILAQRRARFELREPFPQRRPFFDSVVRKAVEVPSEELVAADERVAHHRDAAGAIRLHP